MGCFPTEELLRLFFKKINKGFVLNQQHKQHYLTTIARATTQHALEGENKHIL